MCRILLQSYRQATPVPLKRFRIENFTRLGLLLRALSRVILQVALFYRFHQILITSVPTSHNQACGVSSMTWAAMWLVKLWLCNLGNSTVRGPLVVDSVFDKT